MSKQFCPGGVLQKIQVCYSHIARRQACRLKIPHLKGVGMSVSPGLLYLCARLPLSLGLRLDCNKQEERAFHICALLRLSRDQEDVIAFPSGKVLFNRRVGLQRLSKAKHELS